MTGRPPNLWNDRADGADHEWLAAPPAPPRRRNQAEPPAPEPEKARRRLPLLLAAAAIVLVLAGLGAAALVELLAGPGEAEPVAALPATPGRPPETPVNQIYERASAGVVSVQVPRGGGRASGTGFVIDSDGTIVTNAHVVGDASRAQLRFDDGDRPVPASVVGTDPSSDLAVLNVDPSAVPDPLRPLPLGDSDAVAVGDDVIAIGYPLGLDRTATAGIVSGLRREIRAPNGFRIGEVIQTDAPINPGNSGGPLLDSQGRVIGVNSQIASTGGSGGNVGIGFAVPSNTVRSIVPQLKAGRSIARAYLGVSTSPSPRADGAIVREITPGSPAERAGIRPGSAPDGSDGDVIVAVGGKRVSSPDDVAEAVEARSAGEEVTVTVRRAGGRERELRVELARRPRSTP